MPLGQSDGIIFSVQVSSSQMVLACVKLKQTNRQTKKQLNQYRLGLGKEDRVS